jgi:lysozyme family protein
MSRLNYCIKIVLGNEGGYVEHKNDRGGATNYGVTQKTYDDFCKMTGRHKKPVKSISMEEVELIYSTYWKDAHCSYMPEPLDCQMFDAAINHGPKRAIKFLQRALGVDDDGICGKQTLGALHEEVVISSIDTVCQMYLDERADFFKRIVENDPSQAVFAKGWANRVEHLREMVA